VGHLLAQRVVAILPGAGIRIGLAYLAAQRVVGLGVENGAATGVAADREGLGWKRTSAARCRLFNRCRVREASKNWKSIHHWKPALQSFQLMFGEERVPLAAL